MKSETLASVIRRTTVRELAKMQDKEPRPQHTFHGGEINGWTAAALASWVAPGVIRTVRRFLAKQSSPPQSGSRK